MMQIFSKTETRILWKYAFKLRERNLWTSKGDRQFNFNGFLALSLESRDTIPKFFDVRRLSWPILFKRDFYSFMQIAICDANLLIIALFFYFPAMHSTFTPEIRLRKVDSIK
ncbi:hypothetical protein CEXT_548221 [Caerostris extrusa]|uniref:Uncharacterized protein n=1 Tax=Caerostris extrusa TaxID=172846 RepID=A0AAV4WB01_CAEEX|nr:hypothetical protein CEXT_548221 [Caerostris extrusa]